MAFKILVVGVSAILLQAIKAQPLEFLNAEAAALSNGNNGPYYGLAGNGLNLAGNGLSLAGNGFGLAGNRIGNSGLSSGGGFQVTSSSPIAPTGIAVLAESLAIDGPLNVAGKLPLLATVGLEGSLATKGQAATTYSCGNGNIGISSPLGAGATGAAGLAPGIGVGSPGLGGFGGRSII